VAPSTSYRYESYFLFKFITSQLMRWNKRNSIMLNYELNLMPNSFIASWSITMCETEAPLAIAIQSTCIASKTLCHYLRKIAQRTSSDIVSVPIQPNVQDTNRCLNHLFHNFAAVKKIQWPKTRWNRILVNALYVRVFNYDFSCRSTNENKCFKINSTRTWTNTLERTHVSFYVFMNMQPIVIQYD
jgi:hypothetical protein